jgi:hypothetical protein
MCKKEDTKPEVYWGEASATVNGQLWETKIRGTKSKITGVIQDQFIDILIHKFNEKGFLRGNLSIYKIPKKIGLNRIYFTSLHSESDTTGASYAGLGDDGDVVLSSYIIDFKDTTSFIRVTSYDPKTDVIEGDFQLNFIKDTTILKIEPLIVDTLRFTNGRFKTKILVKR